MEKFIKINNSKKPEFDIKFPGYNDYSYKDEIYAYYIFDSDFIRQGWKVHISCVVSNHLDILKDISSYLVNNKINFKYIYNSNNLIKFLSADISIENLGKFITIYPKQDKIKEIINDIYTIMGSKEHVVVLSDKQYLDSNIYYRYGTIDVNSDYLLSPEGTVISENRKYFSLPYFVEDIFPDNESEDTLPKDIIPYKIFMQSSGGNIYLCKYKERDYILKEARKNVLSSAYGNVINDLKNESQLLKKLHEEKFTPKTVMEFECFGNWYVLEEKLNAQPLSLAISNKEFKEKFSIKEIFLKIIKVIEKIHSYNIILNDINSNNFLINFDKDLSLYVCDFGSSYIKNECVEVDRNKNGITDIFVDDSNFKDERADILKLGYLFMNIIAPVNYFLKYDKTGETSLKKLEKLLKNYEVVYNLIQRMISEYKIDLYEIEQLIRKIPDEYTIDTVEKNFLNTLYDENIENQIVIEYEKYKKFKEIIKGNENLKKEDITEELHKKILIKNLKIKSAFEYIRQYVLTKNINSLESGISLIRNLEENLIIKDKVYFVEKSSEIYNPYIDGGISGVIMLKLLIYNLVHYEDILDSVKPYIDSLLEDNIICKTGFISGGLGMVAVIYDFSILIGDEKLLKESLKKLWSVLLFSINISDYSFVLNEEYSSEDMSFSAGVDGYIYVLEKIIKRELIFNENILE